jgi:hypothetical protein
MQKPTLVGIANDAKWTKEYLATIRQAIRRKDWATAEQYANEISAIWGTLAGMCEEQGRKQNEKM